MKKILLIAFCLAFALTAISCSKGNPYADGVGRSASGEAGTPDQTGGEDVPQPQDMGDFSFSLVFNTYGISSYDSETGKLVKTTDATHPEDYVTEYRLTEEEKQEIWLLVRAMEPMSYPDEYNPFSSRSKPSRNIILTVRYGVVDKTIACRNVSLSDDPADEKGKRVMAVHDKIVEIVTSSDAWKNLPDWEFLYE